MNELLENPCLMPDGHTLTIIYYVTRIPKNVSKAQLPRELLLILSLRLLRDYTSRVFEVELVTLPKNAFLSKL